MKVLVYKDDIITNVYETKEIKLLNNLLKDKNYKVFSDSNASIGVNITHVDEDGTVMNHKQLVDLGLMELPDGYEFDDGGYITLTPPTFEDESNEVE